MTDEIMSVGEEFQSYLDKGLTEEEVKAIFDARRKKRFRDLPCPKCESEDTYRRGRHCSHEYKCRSCGYWWCAYYQLMTPEERQMRKDWSKKHR